MKDILETIKNSVNDYYVREFGEDSEINNETFYENIKNLGIAYSTYDITDDEVCEVQVSANIPDKSILTYINGELIETFVYDNYEDYKEYFEHLDFDEQIGVAIDVFNKLKECEN